MSNIAGILFSTLVQLHNHLLATAAKGLAEARPSETGTGAVEDIELGLLAFKTLSKFFLNGFKNLNEDLTASVSFFLHPSLKRPAHASRREPNTELLPLPPRDSHDSPQPPSRCCL